ncbi:hypothetical protein HanPSC8_Chr17g0791271 [Helianthus annuus]|nr:hypothetical protein HanPSC8_Chr17g0791271 [Helianthus annuus]
MDFGLAFLPLCLSFYTCPFPTLPSYLFTYTSQRMRARERKRGFGRNRPLISILVSGIGESGDADEVQLVVVLSYKFAGLEWNNGFFQHSAPPKLSR